MNMDKTARIGDLAIFYAPLIVRLTAIVTWLGLLFFTLLVGNHTAVIFNSFTGYNIPEELIMIGLLGTPLFTWGFMDLSSKDKYSGTGFTVMTLGIGVTLYGLIGYNGYFNKNIMEIGQAIGDKYGVLALPILGVYLCLQTSLLYITQIDFRSLKEELQTIDSLKEELETLNSVNFRRLEEKLEELHKLSEEIKTSTKKYESDDNTGINYRY